MTDMLPRLANGIVLRRLAPADLGAFQAYRHDAVVGRYQGWAPTPDEDARELLRHMATTALLQPGVWCQVGIADPRNQQLIGDISLLLAGDGRQAEIGFTLRRQSQGRGLATAAVREAIRLVFERTRAEAVVGTVDARNVASIRLLRRVGMQRVETRNATSLGGPYTECVFATHRASLRGAG